MCLKTVGRRCLRHHLIRTRLPMHIPRLLNLKLALITDSLQVFQQPGLTAAFKKLCIPATVKRLKGAAILTV
jgi:hypothetical protein